MYHYKIITIINCIIISISCQIILVPNRLKLDGNDKLLVISNNNDGEAINHHGNVKKFSANLKLSFNRNFKHIIHEERIETTNSIQAWKLSYRNQPKKSSKNNNGFLKLAPQLAMIYMQITFDNGHEIRRQLSIENNWGLGYFQIDKHVYHHSENVHFRLLRLNESTLTPIEDDCQLVIKNQQNIKLEIANLTCKSPEYYAQYSYRLPAIANNGLFVAEIDCFRHKFHDRLTFEIRDYVLPRFRIDIDSPNVYLCPSINNNNSKDQENEPFTIRLRATYTYGKPVNGYAYFKIKFYNHKISNFEQKSSVHCLDYKTGTLEQTIQLSSNFCQSKQNLPQRLLIEAVVTDLSTNQKNSATSDRTILAYFPYRIWTRFTNLIYRPKLANYLTFEITDHDNNPMVNVPMKIHIYDSDKHEISPYILAQNHQTDSNGMLTFTFKLNKIVGLLHVNISTNDPKYSKQRQTMKSLSLIPFDYDHNEYIMGDESYVLISNKKQIWYKAGQHFRSSIVHHGLVDPNRIFLIIMRHESIIEFDRIKSSNIDILLTNKMVPSIRLLILAMTNDDSVVVDFFRIFIRQNNCGVSVELDKNLVEPGKTVTFTFNGQIGDVVALSAIDESMKLLTNNHTNLKQDKLLQKIYRKFLPNFDMISTKEYYRSSDSISLIENFGLQLLHPESSSSMIGRFRRDAPQQKCHRLPLKHPCCQLAYSKFRSGLTCEQKVTILQKQLNRTNNDRFKINKCIDSFSVCCKCLCVEKIVHKSHTPYETRSEIPIAQASHDDIDDERIFKRTDFRDSWLFDLWPLKQRTQNVTMAVPHSITSWIISSTSISNRDGFCVESSDQQIIVFKPFFIQLLMPETIHQYEQTEIRATIYNYHNESLDTYVDFYHINGICSDAYRSLDKTTSHLTIMSNNSATLVFPIIPINIGKFRLRLLAKSGTKWFDYVEKELIVLPPGETREYLHTSDLDPTNRSKRHERSKHSTINEMTEVVDEIYPEKQYQKINISFNINYNNDNIVPGTVIHRLSLIGRRFEPQLKSPDELAHLIRRRKSCGEQTAFYMAFNLYTLKYLIELNHFNRTLLNRGTRYLKRSYGDLISYSKSDGSFSTFINRESSVWLTSFVVNLFCQSEQFLSDELDIILLIKSLRWILSQQSLQIGSWTETNHLHHRHADGGSNQNDVTLTAFVLISLYHCNLFMTKNNYTQSFYTNWLYDYKESDRIATEYLFEKLSRTNNSYTMSIILYSLLLSPSSNIDSYQWMERLLRQNDRLQDIKSNQMYYNNGPLSVETSAYALLSLGRLSYHFVNERHMLANWLSSHPLYSAIEKTQDTLLILASLSDYYHTLTSFPSLEHNFNNNFQQLTTNITYGHRRTNKRENRFIDFQSSSNSNINRFYTIDLNGQSVDQIEIETFGNGMGHVELLTLFNVYDPSVMQSECGYELDVQLFDFTMQHHNTNDDNFDMILDNKQLQESLQIENFSEMLQRKYDEKMRNICHSKLPKNKTIKIISSSNKRPETWETCERDFQNLPLPILLDTSENPVIKILRVCTVKVNDNNNNKKIMIDNDQDQMTILELSILSGYKVIAEDLEELMKNSSIIYWYEISGSKVTFYIRKIPTTYRLCLCFRIYQQHLVHYIQSALAKIYDYDRKESDCRQMYSENHLDKQYPAYRCSDDYCQCLIQQRCSRLNQIEKVIKEYKKYTLKGLELLKKIACSFRYVLNATIKLNKRKSKNIERSLSLKNNNDHYDNNNSSITFIIVHDSTVIIRKPNNQSDSIFRKLRIRFEYPCNYSCIDERIRETLIHNKNLHLKAWIMFNEIISSHSSNKGSSSSLVRMDGQTLFHMIDIDDDWKISDDLLAMLSEGPLQC